MEVTIPANTHVTFYIPAESTSDVSVNAQPVAIDNNYKDGRYIMTAGSGRYSFRVVNRQPSQPTAGSYALHIGRCIRDISSQK